MTATPTLRPMIILGLLGLLLMLPAAGWSCTVSTTGLAFGSYSPFDHQHTDSTANIAVDCESNYTISLDPGQYGSFSPRRMNADNNPARHLGYNLYTGPDYSVVWGDGTSGTVTVGSEGSSHAAYYTVHGRIPARQNVEAGFYRDVITVTIEF